MSLVLSYVIVAKWCLRFRIGMFFRCGCLSVSASLFLVCRHVSDMALLFGNGLFFVYSVRYVLSISAVVALSLMLRELCPLHPCTLIIPFSASMSFLCVVTNSWASMPVSARIVKIVAYFLVDALIILLMFSVVGISGILRSHLYFGLSHLMLFVSQYHL